MRELPVGSNTIPHPPFVNHDFFSSFLLKTFSIIPFQGQNPNIAVRINITPINPAIQREIPSTEKAKTIKMTPMIERKMASTVPTFFGLTIGFIVFSL
jgi:hypothetical protein